MKIRKKMTSHLLDLALRPDARTTHTQHISTSAGVQKLSSLPYRKKSRQKMTNFFANDEFFCRLFFYRLFFYRRLIFTDEYSYRHFFYKREHLLFSNLKIPLVIYSTLNSIKTFKT